MKIFYYRAKRGNFGDDLNGWLWPRLLTKELLERDDSIVMSAIGTLIGEPLPEAQQKIIFSSGIGYRPAPKDFGGAGWKIAAVRGPLTAKVLGLSADKAVTDGAILLANLPDYAPLPDSQRAGVVFMPHHDALSLGKWQAVCQRAGVEFLDPRADSIATAQRLRRARLVLADAMHAAIVADTLRVPWVPLVTSSGINSFKWLDWCLSLEMSYQPVQLPPSSFLEACQSNLYHRFNIGYQLPELTPAAAIRHYQDSLLQRESAKGPLLRRIVGGSMKIMQKAGQMPMLNALHSSLDDQQIATAAAALAMAAKLPGQLSDPAIFEARRKELTGRLEEVVKLVA